MATICGIGSYKKRVPCFAFSAPRDFVEGLIDAYISGDGTLKKKALDVSACSRSRSLRDGISLLLQRFGIYTSLSTTWVHCKIEWGTDEAGNCTQKPCGEEKPLYWVATRAEGALQFAEHITLTHPLKSEILQSFSKRVQRRKLWLKRNHHVDLQLKSIKSITKQSRRRDFVYGLQVEENLSVCATSGIFMKH